jgi:hypothetical protein
MKYFVGSIRKGKESVRVSLISGTQLNYGLHFLNRCVEHFSKLRKSYFNLIYEEVLRGKSSSSLCCVVETMNNPIFCGSWFYDGGAYFGGDTEPFLDHCRLLFTIEDISEPKSTPSNELIQKCCFCAPRWLLSELMFVVY